MSTVIHSSAYAYSKHEESSNFCSGTGSTKNTPTKLLVGDLAAMDQIIEVNPPTPTPIIKTLFGAMSGEFGTVVKVGNKAGEGSITQYLQTPANCNRILSGSIGDIPNSEDWHREVGSDRRDIFGILTKSLNFNITAGNEVIQERTLIATQMETSASDLVNVAEATSARVLSRSVNITVDGITHSALSIPNFTHKIEVDLHTQSESDHVIGDDNILEPTLKDRKHTIQFTSNMKSTNTWFADLLNYTIQKFTITITYGTVAQFTYTYMTVAEEVNEEDLKRGRKTYTYSFIPTEDTEVSQDL